MKCTKNQNLSYEFREISTGVRIRSKKPDADAPRSCVALRKTSKCSVYELKCTLTHRCTEEHERFFYCSHTRSVSNDVLNFENIYLDNNILQYKRESRKSTWIVSEFKLSRPGTFESAIEAGSISFLYRTIPIYELWYSLWNELRYWEFHWSLSELTFWLRFLSFDYSDEFHKLRYQSNQNSWKTYCWEWKQFYILFLSFYRNWGRRSTTATYSSYMSDNTSFIYFPQTIINFGRLVLRQLWT